MADGNDLVREALKHRGVGEPNKFQKWYASRNGAAFNYNFAWCDAWVTYCAFESGTYAAVCPQGDRAYTPWHADDFKRRGQWYPGTASNLRNAEPGDIIFFDWSGSDTIGAIDHVGIVVRANSNGTVTTVEGNITNKVVVKVRDSSTVAGYGRPAYGSAQPEMPQKAPQAAVGDKGIDYAWGRPSPAVLRSQGFRFACRYLSHDQSKDLSKAEARNLANNGIASVVVWETSADRAKDGFDAGKKDAEDARKQAANCDMPPGRPIYFAVDWDATDAELSGPVTEYFKGAVSVLGLSCVGVYGGYRSVKYLNERNVASWFWQTYAWSGGNWYEYNNIEQYAIEVKVDGKDVDLNRAKRVDVGQWYPNVGGPPTKRAETKRYWRFTVNGKSITVPWGSPVIRNGTSGTRVKWLQESLNHLGSKLKVDGDCGPATVSAVRSFQRRAKLPADGEYGNKSANALYKHVRASDDKPKPAPKPDYWRFKMKSGKTVTVPWGTTLLQRGSKGIRVKWLQESLNLAINAKLDVDGDFGPATDAAVRVFQRRHRLTVDGEYGNITSRALYAALKDK